MPGPAPKPTTQRRRRNQTSTATTLVAPTKAVLPGLPKREWHPMTLAWWADVSRSAMAPEYTASDVHGLLMLAVLIDAFWLEPTKELASEIRLQRQAFGLSPLDRRRLQWEIERADEAQASGAQRRARKPAKQREDPRKKAV